MNTPDSLDIDEYVGLSCTERGEVAGRGAEMGGRRVLALEAQADISRGRKPPDYAPMGMSPGGAMDARGRGVMARGRGNWVGGSRAVWLRVCNVVSGGLVVFTGKRIFVLQQSRTAEKGSKIFQKWRDVVKVLFRQANVWHWQEKMVLWQEKVVQFFQGVAAYFYRSGVSGLRV